MRNALYKRRCTWCPVLHSLHAVARPTSRARSPPGGGVGWHSKNDWAAGQRPGDRSRCSATEFQGPMSATKQATLYLSRPIAFPCHCSVVDSTGPGLPRLAAQHVTRVDVVVV